MMNLDKCPAAAAAEKDSESAIAGPKHPRNKKRITNSLTAQNKALKQANSNLMQQIEQAIGESEVAGYGDRTVLTCSGNWMWGMMCCEHCCGGMLMDSGNQDSENPCDNPIASRCCSTCTTNPDPDCAMMNLDKCPAAATEKESEVAGYGDRTVLTCSGNWMWGMMCCEHCCGGMLKNSGWCNFDKYM